MRTPSTVSGRSWDRGDWFLNPTESKASQTTALYRERRIISSVIGSSDWFVIVLFLDTFGDKIGIELNERHSSEASGNCWTKAKSGPDLGLTPIRFFRGVNFLKRPQWLADVSKLQPLPIRRGTPGAIGNEGGRNEG